MKLYFELSLLARFLVTFCLSYLSCYSVLVIGASQAQFMSCPISLSPAGQPFCISDRASYQCRVDSADTLEWRVYNATEYLLGSSTYGPGASVGTIKSFGINFTTNLTSTGGPIVSDIAFRVNSYMINYTLECRALRSIDNDTLATDTCPFVIGDTLPGLSTVVPRISAVNLDNYTISLPYLVNNCFYYSFTMLNSATNITSRTILRKFQYNKTLFTPSIAKTVYIIRAFVKSSLPGYIISSREIRYMFYSPERVSNLTLIQTGLNIDVSWNDPPNSIVPNISSYVLFYKHISADRYTVTIPVPTTTYNIPNATIGSRYTIHVRASNVMGDGIRTSSTITISSLKISSSTSIATSLTSTSIVSVTSSSTSIINTVTSSSTNIINIVTSSSTSIISTVTTSSTSIISTVTSSFTGSDQTTSILSTTSTEAKGTGTISSTEESVIPSISTPSTTDNSTGETNSSVYAGIGAGLAVIVIVILILIIVGCLIWRKPWKGEKDSSEPIALVTMSRYSNPENSQASPIYEEAMASEDITRDAAPTSMRHPPSQLEIPTYMYQDPCIIQRTQAPNLGYLYAEVDKKKEPQKQVVYAQVDKERKKRGNGIVYADLDLASTQGDIFTENIAVNVIYSDIHN